MWSFEPRGEDTLVSLEWNGKAVSVSVKTIPEPDNLTDAEQVICDRMEKRAERWSVSDNGFTNTLSRVVTSFKEGEIVDKLHELDYEYVDLAHEYEQLFSETEQGKKLLDEISEAEAKEEYKSWLENTEANRKQLLKEGIDLEE